MIFRVEARQKLQTLCNKNPSLDVFFLKTAEKWKTESMSSIYEVNSLTNELMSEQDRNKHKPENSDLSGLYRNIVIVVTGTA